MKNLRFGSAANIQESQSLNGELKLGGKYKNLTDQEKLTRSFQFTSEDNTGNRLELNIQEIDDINNKIAGQSISPNFAKPDPISEIKSH